MKVSLVVCFAGSHKSLRKKGGLGFRVECLFGALDVSSVLCFKRRGLEFRVEGFFGFLFSGSC